MITLIQVWRQHVSHGWWRLHCAVELALTEKSRSNILALAGTCLLLLEDYLVSMGIQTALFVETLDHYVQDLAAVYIGGTGNAQYRFMISGKEMDSIEKGYTYDVTEF